MKNVLFSMTGGTQFQPPFSLQRLLTDMNVKKLSGKGFTFEVLRSFIAKVSDVLLEIAG